MVMYCHVCVCVWCVCVGGELGSVVVIDWRLNDQVWVKYQPHSAVVTRLAFAPWK